MNKPDIDINYGRCESCDVALDPFNRMHINWHFVCRSCFYVAKKADREVTNLVRAVFQYTPQFVSPSKVTKESGKL